MPCDLQFERELWAEGFECVAGVDEAGRGPLAGPVFAAAVILPKDFAHGILTDSKKLRPSVREILYSEITTNERILWSSGRADVHEIDALNILRATHLAMRRAVEGLFIRPQRVLMDGLEVRDFPIVQRALVGGDGLSLSIAAASIVAKVQRDRFMVDMSLEYPEYGFAQHKGYGTRQHLESLRLHGPCPLHRRSFRPISQLAFDFDTAGTGPH